MPVTFFVLIVIFDSGVLGSAGAVAKTVMLPVVPPEMHCPIPELFRRKKSATVVNGGFADHVTLIGAVVPSEKVPMAVN